MAVSNLVQLAETFDLRDALPITTEYSEDQLEACLA